MIALDGVVAVGEIGLDKKYEKFGVSLDVQKKVFEKMIGLAKEYSLPLVVHSGRSYKEVFEMLDSVENNVLMHWYSGSISMAVEYSERGNFFFSFGPAILKYDNYKGYIYSLDLDFLLTETDYPVRVGGRENHPARVIEVLEKIAEIKGLPRKKVEEKVERNFKRFLGV